MKNLLFEIENSICTIIVNRPDQYNALNIETLKEIDLKFDCIKKNNNIRVVIITGAGEKAFISGADIASMSKMDKNDAKIFSSLGQNLTSKIENYHIPVIAAVNGYALGGGCEIAMSCHLRYASNNAIFGQPEVNLGLIAGWGGTKRLPSIVGKSKAFEILLTGQNINAKIAKSIGLVNDIYSIKNLVNKVKKHSELIIKNAPLAIKSTIKSVNYGQNLSNEDAFKYEKQEFSKLFKTRDLREGLNAFINKRKPEYRGE